MLLQNIFYFDKILNKKNDKIIHEKLIKHLNK